MRNCIIVFIIIFCCLQAFVAQAVEQDQIKKYIEQNYPADFFLTNAQLDQLSWAFAHETRSYDMDVLVDKPELHVEISRALTRMYCARLLRSGNRESYHKFVKAQIESGITQPLTIATYNKLAQHMQNIKAEDYELLENAAILSAVSLSKPAAQLAQKVIDIQPEMLGAGDFLAATLRSEMNIYPLVAQNTAQNEAAKKILFILFPPQTNFRHMLYTEGGIGMFNYLRTMIRHGFIDQTALDLWYAHWIINIAGFRGAIKQNGSIYLNEPVAQAMLSLKSFVDEMLHDPNLDPLTPYLQYRAKSLGFDQLPREQSLFLAHMACMLRIYTVAEANKLQQALHKLSKEDQQQVFAYFISGLEDPTLITPTHVPALFANALELSNGDVGLVIARLMPIYNSAIAAISKQNLSRLCFNQLSASVNLQRILASDATFKLLIEKDGTVMLG
jgi:hypothetical protein